MSNAASEYNELLDIVSDIVNAGHMDQEDLARLRAHLGHKPAALAQWPQGSGEPVAQSGVEGLRAALAALVKAHDDMHAARRAVECDEPEPHAEVAHTASRIMIETRIKEARAALNAAPPSAQQATCRDDGRCQYAIDHGAEGMGHCPPGKCAMPPSAQQATGSGQVLTDEVEAYLEASDALYNREISGPNAEPYDILRWRMNKAREHLDKALAAATQAQPEADREALADVTRQTLAELCEAREWHPKYRAKYLAVLAGIDTLAAPTTGKREAEAAYHAWAGSVDDEVALRKAVSVCDDILTDIADWEDKALAEAVTSVREDLSAMADRIKEDGTPDLAAPTTDKREPLTDSQIADAVPQFYAHSAREQDAILKAVRSLGITGEQR